MNFLAFPAIIDPSLKDSGSSTNLIFPTSNVTYTFVDFDTTTSGKKKQTCRQANKHVDMHHWFKSANNSPVPSSVRFKLTRNESSKLSSNLVLKNTDVLKVREAQPVAFIWFQMKDSQ